MTIAGYTTPRLGTPVENPEIYHESAPIHHMEHLVRPLLVLHGTIDRNVAFRDSLQLIRRAPEARQGLRDGRLSRQRSISSAGRTSSATRGSAPRTSSTAI